MLHYIFFYLDFKIRNILIEKNSWFVPKIYVHSFYTIFPFI